MTNQIIKQRQTIEKALAAVKICGLDKIQCFPCQFSAVMLLHSLNSPSQPSEPWNIPEVGFPYASITI